MSIFKEYYSVNKNFEKIKYEKVLIIESSREVIDNNILKFIPTKDDTLLLEIHDNNTKHTINFSESGTSSLLKYLNKHLVPNNEPSKIEENKSSNTSKQHKKS